MKRAILILSVIFCLQSSAQKLISDYPLQVPANGSLFLVQNGNQYNSVTGLQLKDFVGSLDFGDTLTVMAIEGKTANRLRVITSIDTDTVTVGGVTMYRAIATGSGGMEWTESVTEFATSYVNNGTLYINVGGDKFDFTTAQFVFTPDGIFEADTVKANVSYFDLYDAPNWSDSIATATPDTALFSYDSDTANFARNVDKADGSFTVADTLTVGVVSGVGGLDIEYGYLYNWYVTDSIASAGWRVPSDADWDTLIAYLGGASVAGGKLKEEGLEYWDEPNTGATNEVGFNAKGGGVRLTVGTFTNIRIAGYWWSATEFNATNARYRSIFDNDGGVLPGSESKKIGYSLRTMRDSTSTETGMADGTIITAAYTGNDGTVYDAVKIGSQVWINQNLIETKLNTGADITEVTDNATWAALTTGARCSYDNDEANAFTGEAASITALSPIYYDSISIGTRLIQFSELATATVDSARAAATADTAKVSAGDFDVLEKLYIHSPGIGTGRDIYIQGTSDGGNLLFATDFSDDTVRWTFPGSGQGGVDAVGFRDISARNFTASGDITGDNIISLGDITATFEVEAGTVRALDSVVTPQITMNGDKAFGITPASETDIVFHSIGFSDTTEVWGYKKVFMTNSGRMYAMIEPHVFLFNPVSATGATQSVGTAWEKFSPGDSAFFEFAGRQNIDSVGNDTIGMVFSGHLWVDGSIGIAGSTGRTIDIRMYNVTKDEIVKSGGSVTTQGAGNRMDLNIKGYCINCHAGDKIIIQVRADQVTTFTFFRGEIRLDGNHGFQ